MNEPFDFQTIKPSAYGDKRPVEGEIVALLHVSFENRRLKIIETKSRVVTLNEIHELMITDEDDVTPKSIVNRVRALAFFEITIPGLIVVGDQVTSGKKKLGKLVGYDLTHMPNHMNIVVKPENLEKHKIKLGEKIRFTRTVKPLS
jgi:hypothetical protein